MKNVSLLEVSRKNNFGPYKTRKPQKVTGENWSKWIFEDLLLPKIPEKMKYIQ